MFHDWLHHGYWLGNPALAWVSVGVGALLGYALAQSIALFLKSRLTRLAERTQRRGLFVAARVAAATHGWLLLLLAIAVALNFLQFRPPFAHWLGQLTFLLVGIQLASWAGALVVGWIHGSATPAGFKSANPVMLGVLTWAIQSVIWITLLLAVMANGGVKITAFVASLGVGGVAVALALQNVLTDLFSSIAIGLDKPFEVGEYIAFDPGTGSEQGTVVKVGIKSTRIQSLSGEELAVSNSVLLKNLIHNYSRQRERRVRFTFKLPFDTPRDKIPAAIAKVRGFIEREKSTRFDRGYLSGFGDYALEFEFVYYILDPSYATFVEIQQRINLALLGAFDELGITLAIPARQLQQGVAPGGPAVQVTPAAD